MVGADPTRARDLPPQRLAGPEDSHASVACRDAGGVGVVFDGDAVNLDAP